MDIQKQFIHIVEKYSLKEKALESVEGEIDACIEFDKELGIDFLDGYDKADLIYEFGRYEFQIDKNNNPLIATKVNIYSKKLYGPDCDVPIGHYTELTDLNGEHRDEFLTLDWSPINFNIDYYVEQINKTVPRRYFKRNIPEYRFNSYINNLIVLVQSKSYNTAILFIKRCYDFLDENHKPKLDPIYLKNCNEFLKNLFFYLKENNLYDFEKFEKFNLDERIKTKS